MSRRLGGYADRAVVCAACGRWPAPHVVRDTRGRPVRYCTRCSDHRRPKDPR